jgi:hypothetical protein
MRRPVRVIPFSLEKHRGPLTRKGLDEEQVQPSAIAVSYRDADRVIGCTMIDISRPFNGDALKPCLDTVEFDPPMAKIETAV